MKYYLHEIKKAIGKRSYFYVITLMLMASTFFPITDNLRFITNHMGWSIVCFLSLIVFKPQIFQNKILLFVLFYSFTFLILLNSLWANVDEGNKNQIINEIREMLIAISVLTYYRIEQDYLHLAKLIRWTFLFMFITAFMTIITSYIDPLFVRNLTNISVINSKNELDSLSRYKKLGGGNYSFASAIICLFPMLVYYFKNNSKCIFRRRYLLIFIIVFFFALIRTQIFANILISLFVIFFSIIGSKYIKTTLFISVIAIAVILFLPTQFYKNILSQINTWFPVNSNIHYKIDETIKFLIFGDQNQSAITYRANRYPLLLKPFIANPFLGHFISGSSNDIVAGIHLHWMNKLAVFGLLGTIPLLYIIYKYIKDSVTYFDKEFRFYFLLSVLSILVLGLMKTLSGGATWYTFFIIVPGFYYLKILKSNQKNISNAIRKYAVKAQPFTIGHSN